VKWKNGKSCPVKTLYINIWGKNRPYKVFNGQDFPFFHFIILLNNISKKTII
jgi:hypothetical protein